MTRYSPKDHAIIQSGRLDSKALTELWFMVLLNHEGRLHSPQHGVSEQIQLATYHSGLLEDCQKSRLSQTPSGHAETLVLGKCCGCSRTAGLEPVASRLVRHAMPANATWRLRHRPCTVLRPLSRCRHPLQCPHTTTHRGPGTAETGRKVPHDSTLLESTVRTPPTLSLLNSLRTVVQGGVVGTWRYCLSRADTMAWLDHPVYSGRSASQHISYPQSAHCPQWQSLTASHLGPLAEHPKLFASEPDPQKPGGANHCRRPNVPPSAAKHGADHYSSGRRQCRLHSCSVARSVIVGVSMLAQGAVASTYRGQHRYMQQSCCYSRR
eukprot:COSAG02_NODE_79_length_40228_cov_18.435762_6_plen_323_part_00